MTATLAHAVEKHLTLSLLHLSPHAHTYLTSNRDRFRLIETSDSGLTVYVPESPPGNMPADLAAILTAATDLGCWWIDFDHAVPPCGDQLPIFETAMAA